MQWMQGYPFYLLIASALGFVLSALSYRYRTTPGKRYFWILILLGSLVVLTTVFELMATSYHAKLWWRNIQQIPLFSCGLINYALVMDYIGKSNARMENRLKLLSLPVLLYVVLIFTDQFHHLMRSDIGLFYMGDLSEISVEPTLLSMCFITYIHIFELLSVFLLAVNVRNSPGYYRKQNVMLLAGMLFPVVLIFLLPVLHVHILGFSALTFLPAGFFMYYALFRYQLLSVWPIAKDKIFFTMKDGIVLTDHYDTIVDVNPAAERVLQLLGRKGSNRGWLGQSIHPYLQGYSGLLSAYAGKEETGMEISLPGPGETESSYSVTLIPIGLKRAEKKGMVFVFSDISDKKRYERELIHQATIDELTGVNNRRHFLNRVADQMDKDGSAASLLLLDIDDFKLINDTYGHVAGDRTLSEFAATLRIAFAGKGIAGRVGGEEFAVFLSGVREEEGRKEAERFRRLLEAHPIILKGQKQIRITVSVGVACMDKPGVTFEELYQQADEALYDSKKSGKNRVTVGRGQSA